MKRGRMGRGLGRWLLGAVAVFWVATAPAGSLVISSLSGDGTLNWTYPTNGVIGYRVEWAPRAGGPWTNTWDDLAAIAPTGTTMSASVPMFYRLVAVVHDYLVIDLSGGPTATQYPVSYLTGVPDGGWTADHKTTKMVLRFVPSGTFTMGSPFEELGRVTNEAPHQVTLTRGFYVGLFEVTQAQWYRVMGTWPAYFSNPACRDARPVENISYHMIRGSNAGSGWPASADVDADSFLGRLRARTGLTFDLPTEAQWEYAARAGTLTALNSGKNLTSTTSCPNVAEVARYYYNHPGGYSASSGADLNGGTAAVGTYQPNAWGLYDLHGNVREWCRDWYALYTGDATDPTGPGSGTYRVIRGGAWLDTAFHCRSADRIGYFNEGGPGDNFYHHGFRVIMAPGP